MTKAEYPLSKVQEVTDSRNLARFVNDLSPRNDPDVGVRHGGRCAKSERQGEEGAKAEAARFMQRSLTHRR